MRAALVIGGTLVTSAAPGGGAGEDKATPSRFCTAGPSTTWDAASRTCRRIATTRQAVKAALAGQELRRGLRQRLRLGARHHRGDTSKATVRAAGDNLHRYVFMSSVAAYGDGLNHHEGDALAPDDASGSVRAQQGDERAGAVPPAPADRIAGGDAAAAVRLRTGKNNPFYREAFFWDRLRAARPIILPGDGRRLMQFVYVKDLVRAALKVAGRAGCGRARVQHRQRAADVAGRGGGGVWRRRPRSR